MFNPGLFEPSPDRTEVVLHVDAHNRGSARRSMYRDRSCSDEHTIGNPSSIHLRNVPVPGQTKGFEQPDATARASTLHVE